MKVRTEGLKIGPASALRRQATYEGLLVGGEIVLGISNTKVPHETGATEQTGTVSGDAENQRVAISYDDTAYEGQAVDLHEDMHLRHDPGRSAKYLEKAMAEARDQVLEAVAGRLRRVF